MRGSASTATTRPVDPTCSAMIREIISPVRAYVDKCASRIDQSTDQHRLWRLIGSCEENLAGHAVTHVALEAKIQGRPGNRATNRAEDPRHNQFITL